jgi:hypothetical protein
MQIRQLPLGRVVAHQPTCQKSSCRPLLVKRWEKLAMESWASRRADPVRGHVLTETRLDMEKESIHSQSMRCCDEIRIGQSGKLLQCW